MKSDLKTLRGIFGNPKGDYSVDNLGDVEDIIIKYTSQDLTPRTMKGHNKQLLIEPAYKPLAKLIFDFIHGEGELDEQSFDKWHADTCKKFQKWFNVSSGMPVPLPYGKAQKIVNMTFKNLLCCSHAEKYLGRFVYCHMPLDSYTLDDWFKGDVLKWYQDETHEKVTKGWIPSWSNLDYSNYIWIQDQIRQYLKNADHIYRDEDGKALTPLQAEFYIWPEQKWLRSTKGLFDQDILKDVYPKYHHEALAKQAKEFLEKAEKLKKFI